MINRRTVVVEVTVGELMELIHGLRAINFVEDAELNIDLMLELERLIPQEHEDGEKNVR